MTFNAMTRVWGVCDSGYRVRVHEFLDGTQTIGWPIILRLLRFSSGAGRYTELGRIWKLLPGGRQAGDFVPSNNHLDLFTYDEETDDD